MKVFNITFIVLFVVSAALQYNDPDPYLWVPIYLLGAYLCWQATKKIYKPALYIIALVVYSGYAIFLFFNNHGVLNWINEHDSENIVQSMKATKPWIEATREFGGLFILIFVLICNMVWLSKSKRQTV